MGTPSKDLSIVDRIDELREFGVAVTPRTVDENILRVLRETQRGGVPDTPYRQLVLGFEYMEQMRVPAQPEDGQAIGTFVIVGNDPSMIAAWEYTFPIMHPKHCSRIYRSTF